MVDASDVSNYRLMSLATIVANVTDSLLDKQLNTLISMTI